jgi:hypothetical protein
MAQHERHEPRDVEPETLRVHEGERVRQAVELLVRNLLPTLLRVQRPGRHGVRTRYREVMPRPSLMRGHAAKANVAKRGLDPGEQ